MSASMGPQSPYSLFGPSEDGKVSDLLAGKSDAESRVRLQALIAEWLRMENLVVLTAARCSVGPALGGKTMVSLQDAVLETLAKHPGVPSEAKKVVDRRQWDIIVGDSGGLTIYDNQSSKVYADGSHGGRSA